MADQLRYVGLILLTRKVRHSCVLQIGTGAHYQSGRSPVLIL
jgi:hypothetical protein